jgi:hypothetical protein
MITILLYLLLQVYPPVGISPIVSGFKNLRRNTLLHADAIVRDSRKTPIFPISKNSLKRHDRLVVVPLRHPDSMLQGRVCYGMLETCVPLTMLGIPHAPLPHLVHSIIRYVGHRPNIMEVFLSVKVVGVP